MKQMFALLLSGEMFHLYLTNQGILHKVVGFLDAGLSQCLRVGIKAIHSTQSLRTRFCIIQPMDSV